jgi:hypothetical protein
MSALKELNLASNRLGDEACARLAESLTEVTSLQSLELGFNQIGSSGCRVLAPVLARQANLAELDLRFNDVRDDGLKELAWSFGPFPALTKLLLEGNPVALPEDIVNSCHAPSILQYVLQQG